MQKILKNPVNHAVCETVDREEILNQVQNDRKAVVELEGQSVETLTRISNFRRAQIEILPSHSERGKFAQLFSHLKRNKKVKSCQEGQNETSQVAKMFGDHPSLIVRGKNFLANCGELRNLGEGFSNIITNKGKKAAFTLAEVLITIAVVGVVSAMTIPNLITAYQKKQTATRLKDTYAILTNSVRLAEKDYDSISGWELNQADVMTDVNKYLLPYLKATTRTANEIRYKYKELTGDYETGLNIFSYSKDITVISLLNGVDLITAPFKYNLSRLQFIVDINGYNSGPNQYGKDTFYIQIVPEVGVTFMRKDDNESWSTVKTRQQLLNGPSGSRYQCNKKGRGTWCGELIRRDGWKISPDYPW